MTDSAASSESCVPASVCLMKTFSSTIDSRTYPWLTTLARQVTNPDPPAGPTHPHVSIRPRLNRSKILIPVRRRSPTSAAVLNMSPSGNLNDRTGFLGPILLPTESLGDDRLNQIFIRNGRSRWVYTERICLVSSHQSQQRQQQMILSIVDCIDLVIVIYSNCF